jgi:hypothetical protein
MVLKNCIIGKYLSNIEGTWAIFNFRLKSKWITSQKCFNSFFSHILILNVVSTIRTIAAITIYLCCKALTVPNNQRDMFFSIKMLYKENNETITKCVR